MAIIKLLLVDDHGPLRNALREGLQATGAVLVIGEAATGREAVTRALELDMDVVLMDVQLHDEKAARNALSGVGAAVGLRRDRPRPPRGFFSFQQRVEDYYGVRVFRFLDPYRFCSNSEYLESCVLVPLLRVAT